MGYAARPMTKQMRCCWIVTIWQKKRAGNPARVNRVYIINKSCFVQVSQQKESIFFRQSGQQDAVFHQGAAGSVGNLFKQGRFHRFIFSLVRIFYCHCFAHGEGFIIHRGDVDYF